MKVAGVDDVRGDEATIMREVGGGSQRQRRRGRGGWKSDNCHLLTHTSNIEILLTLSEQKLHLKISGSNCHKNVLKRSIWLSDDWPWRLRCYEWFLWFQKLSELLIVLCFFFLNVTSKKFNTFFKNDVMMLINESGMWKLRLSEVLWCWLMNPKHGSCFLVVCFCWPRFVCICFFFVFVFVFVLLRLSEVLINESWALPGHVLLLTKISHIHCTVAHSA